MYPWKAIVDTKSSKDESFSMRKLSSTRTSFNYSAVFVYELTLECGHKRIVRGSAGVPKKRSRCKLCPEAS
jgi:hypothetical protein